MDAAQHLLAIPVTEQNARKSTIALAALAISAALVGYGGMSAALSQATSSSLYSVTAVSHPAIVSNTLPQSSAVLRGTRPQGIATGYIPQQYATETMFADAAQREPHATHVALGVSQSGIIALVGMALSIVSALFVRKFHNQSKPHWAMTAVSAEAPADPKTTHDDMLLARQMFLAEHQGAEAPMLEEGEGLRTTTFPGNEGPADLKEMYGKFEEMLDGFTTSYVAGNRVKGTVCAVDDKGVTVDFGGKDMGFCPSDELALCKVANAGDVLAVGEEREFEIIATGGRKDGDVTLLSLKRIALEVAWKRLQQYRENDVTFSCVLLGKNRGGYMTEVSDLAVPGFLPRSQANSDLATAPDDDESFMNVEVDVKILDLDQERQRLVVSQRAATPRVAADSFRVGTVHEGVVQNVKPYGAFVDVGGMSGLLHISQISHSRIENVETVFTAGDKIKCMVLSQDPVQGRLSLSTKRLEPTHGDMLTNPELVYEKAEEMAERFREDIAAAEKRMQEFEKRLTEQANEDQEETSEEPEPTSGETIAF